jgi:hypothetical protein
MHMLQPGPGVNRSRVSYRAGNAGGGEACVILLRWFTVTGRHVRMKPPLVIIGIGEMGGVFARGFLRTGHPVYPITRETDIRAAARELPAPELVLVAVAENTLHAVLETLPAAWQGRAALLQNELLPRDWERYGLVRPTVISVWFEKKRGQDIKVLIPSPIHGPHADRLRQCLASLDIPTRILGSDRELLFELVAKNLYIVTTNCAGLVAGGTVSGLWDRHRDLAQDVAHEVIRIQESLAGTRFDAERLMAAMLTAFAGDPEHQCTGRPAWRAPCSRRKTPASGPRYCARSRTGVPDRPPRPGAHTLPAGAGNLTVLEPGP